jgi:hypothetical protein
VANILVLTIVAAGFGQYLAFHGGSPVVTIAQRSLAPSLVASMMSPLVDIALPLFQRFPGHQSRTARSLSVMQAQSRPGRQLQSGGVSQPVVMNDGIYVNRWQFLDSNSSAVDIDLAKAEALRWLAGEANIQRIFRPDRIQFEWFVTTNRLQQPGFDG